MLCVMQDRTAPYHTERQDSAMRTMLIVAIKIYTLITTPVTVSENIFAEYERCIGQKVRMLQMNILKPIPEGVITQEGDRVKLHCGACHRPDEEWSELRVVWHRVRPELKETQPVPIGEMNFQLDYDNSLVIDGAGEIHGAHYLCVSFGLVQSAYYLEVIPQRAKKLVVRQGRGARPAKNLVLEGNNIQVFTVWQEWSDCSACDKVGLRKRTGICTIKKIIAGVRSDPIDIKALDIFLNGLPCQSSSAAKLSPYVKAIRRQSEILVDYCYRACPTKPPIRNITDKTGFVIEQVKGDSYSVHEAQPALPPLVHRETHYLPPGAKINFTCPEDKLKSKGVGVRWENGDQVINSMSIRRATRGRIYIDRDNRLQFKRVRPLDTGYYSCWQNGWLVAVFRIVCQQTTISTQSLPDVVYFLGLIIAIVTVFCVGCQMWRSRKDKRYT